MNATQWVGVIGAATGIIVGFAGGIYGTLNSLRYARGPREKQFLIRASIACWIGITIFILLLLFLPLLMVVPPLLLMPMPSTMC